MNRTVLIPVVLFLALSAEAHHSPNLHFIRGDIVEIAGELTQAEWQNPHTQLAVTTLAEDGSEVIWLIEGRSASQFARAGVTRDLFRIGDDIRVAGFRGRRNPTAMFATNILLASGRELVADNFVEPRWPGSTAMMLTVTDQAAARETLPTEVNGIFRIWSRDSSDHGIEGTGRTLWVPSYPLTEQARATQERWDPIADNPYIRCRNGMPALMDLATPMEFVQEGDDIVLYLEEQDSIRRIHMRADVSASSAAPSPFGYSVGRWDGDTLEVTTTDIDWPWFDQTGIPQSAALRLVERFMPSPDGRVLGYEITVTDSATFTEPVILDRVWVWRANEVLRPYNCIWDRDDL